jgi:hypothetical protein
MDVWTLIERDHRELDLALCTIAAEPDDLSGLFEGAKLGFAAHAEAHARMLQAVTGVPPHVAGMFRELEAAHVAQERQLLRIAGAPFSEWRHRAAVLREELRQHHEYERTWCLPALRARGAVFGTLAATYATERLRALAWAWQVVPVRAEARLRDDKGGEPPRRHRTTELRGA